jgi:ATP-binding cassette, subfamily B, multidrug efflux pump
MIARSWLGRLTMNKNLKEAGPPQPPTLSVKGRAVRGAASSNGKVSTVDYYHEEETGGWALFNGRILRILYGYVMAYKKQLFFSLACVVVITSATLAVPFLGRIIVDRYVVKQGYRVTQARLAAAGSAELIKREKRALRLADGYSFLFQSQLSFFSEAQIRSFVAAGALSSQKYTLIEGAGSSGTGSAGERLLSFVARGEALEYPGGLYLVIPASLAQFTNKELLALRKADVERAGMLVLLILAVFVVQFAASYLQIVSLMRLSQRSMRDLRRDLFAHVMSLETAFFDVNPVGKLVNRVTNDIEALNEMFSSVLVTLFQDILILAGITAILFFTNVYLACGVAITFPFLFAVTLVFRIKARGAYRVIRTKLAELNAFLNENISGMRIVQMFVQEAKQLRRFGRINNEVYAANLRQVVVYAVFRPLIDFFRWFAVAAVVYLGANLIADGIVSYGLVLMFLSYVGTFFEPIGDLSEKFDIMQSATAAGEKILSVFNAAAAKEKTEAAADAAFRGRVGAPANGAVRLRGEVAFDDVWFGYNPGEWVLRGVSFSIKPMQTLAIVGETGSGKSTIISLLARLYQAGRGTISIDGIDVRDIPYGVVRGNIATVMQDVFLFSRTVRENVTLGKGYDEGAFDRAAAATHLDGFLRRLPDGREENVMERGVTFSAGERQLIAFARALYADPSILVLDEATSNIDTETERLIQDAIARLVQGRTSIVIAHRLSTIQNAHRILVLEKGVIAEEGDHASLLAKRGLYYELYKLQFGIKQ